MSVNQFQCHSLNLHHLLHLHQAKAVLPRVKKRVKQLIKSRRDQEKARKRSQGQSDHDLTVEAEKKIKGQFIHFHKKKDHLETCQIEVKMRY